LSRAARGPRAAVGLPPAALAALAALAGCGLGGGAGAGAAPPPSFGAPVLLWANGGCFTSWCQTGWYASPALADLDGVPATKEILWGGYDLVALDPSDGRVRWRSPSPDRIWASPAVADLAGDGRPEVVVARGSRVDVLSADGSPLWSAAAASGELRTLLVADLEGDGAAEVLAGRAAPTGVEQVAAWRGADGAPLAGFPARRAGEAGYGWALYNENLAAGDLDGDGDLELVNPTDTHYITALDHAGNQLPASAIYGAGKVWSEVGVHVSHAVDLRGHASCGVEHRPNFADSAPVIADLDGDGTREIAVVGNVYDCARGYPPSLYQIPFLLRGDRTRWARGGLDWTELPAPPPGSAPRSEDHAVIETALPNPAIGDLDGDGRAEVVFSSYDGRVHAWSLDRTEKGSWPFVVPGAGIRFASEPAIADLDGDGKAEVIVGTWGEKARRKSGQLLVLDHLGRLLYAVDLPPSFPTGAWNGALGAPTVANVDGDPDVEILVGTAQAGLVAFRVPRTAGARVAWGTGRGGFTRRGTPDPGP